MERKPTRVEFVGGPCDGEVLEGREADAYYTMTHRGTPGKCIQRFSPDDQREISAGAPKDKKFNGQVYSVQECVEIEGVDIIRMHFVRTQA